MDNLAPRGIEGAFSVSPRVPISADGTHTACKVSKLTSEDANFLSTFAKDYRNQQPVIITNVASKWKSSQWAEESNLNQLLQLALEKMDDVEVLIANDNRNFLRNELCEVEKMALATAWEQILYSPDNIGNRTNKYSRIYLDQFPELAPYFDLELLTECARFGHQGEDLKGFKERNIGFWVSTPSCTTPLHFDLCHGFLCQVLGNKTFILAPPEDATSCFYWRHKTKGTSELNRGKNETTCPVDLEKWLSGDEEQQKRFPRVQEAAFFIAELHPGDVLYTPPGFLHTVFSETRSASLLVPFDPTPTEKMACTIQALY